MATHFFPPYIGDIRGLAYTLVHVKGVTSGDRIVLDVTCPFCQGQMSEASLQGRPGMREQRNRYATGHRMSLTPRPDGGFLGWL